jgi:hypothetical protein
MESGYTKQRHILITLCKKEIKKDKQNHYMNKVDATI